ncbi:MAG: glycosyl transferase family 2 [Bacteroidetes bacterium]|nr:MAG: glycosyl transferase family 2 [Bacteroidota bacterium]
MDPISLIRVIKFGIVGFSGLGVDFSVTYVLKEKVKFNKYVANTCGFCCAVISNFFLNAYWTFSGSLTRGVLQFSSFALIAMLGLLINTVVIFLLVKKADLNFYLSKLAAIAVVFVWNYLMNNYVTFSNPHL